MLQTCDPSRSRNNLITKVISWWWVFPPLPWRKAGRSCSWLSAGLAPTEMCFHLLQVPLCHIQWPHSDMPGNIVSQKNLIHSPYVRRVLVLKMGGQLVLDACDVWHGVKVMYRNLWKTSLMWRRAAFHANRLLKSICPNCSVTLLQHIFWGLFSSAAICRLSSRVKI